MIDLQNEPSEDGLGVLCWTYPLKAGRTLRVFKRPIELARVPYLLRVDHANGMHVESRFALDRDGAIAAARNIERHTRNAEA